MSQKYRFYQRRQFIVALHFNKQIFVKIKVYHIDLLILLLLSYVVLVDMTNGFFMMNYVKLPISQVFKLLVLILFFLRLSFTKDFLIVLLIFFVFLIGPIHGLLVSKNLSNFGNDLVVSTKWANVPISFFFFKNLFQSPHFVQIKKNVITMIRRSVIFIAINLFIGVLGYGMAFYNHGYNNAVGTKGFIYAGNELTILILSLGFSIASYFYLNKRIKPFLLCLALFFGFSFFIVSKTVLLGVILVFLTPVFSKVKIKVSKKFVKNIFAVFFFLAPLLIFAAVIGVKESGVIERIQGSLKRNNNDWLTVILSNRNNFIKEGWVVFQEEFSFFGKLLGYGQKFHLELSGHLAEVDFFSLLFASGFLGLFVLLIIIVYWFVNANHLRKKQNYIFAPPVFLFLFFLVIVSNLSGHIFGSGIAGFFVGFSIALMFYKKSNFENQS